MNSQVYNFYRHQGEKSPDFASVTRLEWGKDRGRLVTYTVTRFAQVEGGYKAEGQKTYLTMREAFDVLEGEGFIHGSKPSI